MINKNELRKIRIWLNVYKGISLIKSHKRQVSRLVKLLDKEIFGLKVIKKKSREININ
jgi:hypothetical protein